MPVAPATRAPDGWSAVRLGDVAEVTFSSVDKKTVDGEIPIRLCNYTDVFYNRQVSIDMPFMEATARPTECQRWALRQGDVLFTKDSETVDEIGVPSYVASDMPDVLCGYHLGRARPIRTSLDAAFLARALASRAAAREFSRIANGITRFGLTLDATRALRLFLPPLSEQRAIAAVLDSIDEAIERADEVIAATERLRDALLHELLTRGLPGQHSEWKEVPGLGTIPASWRAVHLGHVCEAPQYGAGAPARPFDPSLPRYVRITDITDDGHLRRTDARSADPERVGGYELEAGDLLFARSGSVGKSYLYRPEDGPCVYAGYLIRFRACGDAAVPRFLELWTRGPFYRKWVTSMMRAGAQPNINATEYSSLPIALPPLAEQWAIAEVLEHVRIAVKQAGNERETRRHLQTSVTDALLTGRVRIPRRV